MKDGVIKFNENKIDHRPLRRDEIEEIEKYRALVHQKELIGHDKIHNVGYGNISKRDGAQFIISGSQTGHLEHLTVDHYVRVIAYNHQDFSVTSEGVARASSESLTHAAFYEANPSIGAIVHTHHLSLWERLIEEGIPSTPKSIEYGTYELAMLVKEMVHNKSSGVLVTIGHEGGIFAYGRDLKEAVDLLFAL